MATAKQRKAYERKLREISRSFGRLERSTLRQSVELLKDVRNQVAGQLTGTDFSQFRIAEQQRAIDDIVARYEAQARALANGSTRGAFALGEQSVTEPLQDAGIGASFFRPSEAQVEVLAQFSADLIGGVSDAMRTKINRDIRLNALGGNSSLDAMRDITKTLGIPPKASDPTKGVAYEAERILRTETNRTYNLASNAQQEALAEDVPGLQKQWIATGDARTRLSHLQAHGQIVDVGEPFKVGGAELRYPLDPKGGPHETINCRCTSITVIPEIGPLESPLDAEIEAEKERRGQDEKAKRPSPKNALMAKLPTGTQASLNRFGDSLNVYQPGGETLVEYSKDLAKVPDKLVTELRKQGVTVHISDSLNVTDIPGMEHLKGVRPRGWPPGSTWDDIGGAYNGSGKRVIAGQSANSGTFSQALHEYGHAADRNLGLSDNPRWIALHKEDYDFLEPYYQQGGPGGGAGRAELFAEAFATVVKDRNEGILRFGTDAVELVEDLIK